MENKLGLLNDSPLASHHNHQAMAVTADMSHLQTRLQNHILPLFGINM